VDIHVLQGDRPMAQDNRTLGRFQLTDIPAAPRGIPHVEVTFDIDANGIVHVSAKDKGTGREQKITITTSSGLSKEEVEKMRKEAELHADEDKQKREKVDIKNESDALIYSAEKTISENKDKISDSQKKDLEAKIADMKKVLEGSDLEAIKKKKEELQKLVYDIGAALYQQQPQGGAQGTGSQESAQGKDEKVVDAAYEEVKEEDKNKNKDEKDKDKK
jgi:molecular chaperone DnaK